MYDLEGCHQHLNLWITIGQAFEPTPKKLQGSSWCLQNTIVSFHPIQCMASFLGQKCTFESLKNTLLPISTAQPTLILLMFGFVCWSQIWLIWLSRIGCYARFSSINLQKWLLIWLHIFNICTLKYIYFQIKIWHWYLVNFHHSSSFKCRVISQIKKVKLFGSI